MKRITAEAKRQDSRVERKARLTIYFFSEVTSSMSTSPLRAAMVPVTRQMRAYFAPVNRTTETPTIFDPGQSGTFPLDAPPAPWVDLGWVENFERWYDTPTDVVRSGAKGLAAVQFRGPLEARVEFDFRQWGKLQMALAGGSEHMNVLAPAGKCGAGALGRNSGAGSGSACGLDGERTGVWGGSGELRFRRVA